MVINQLFTLVQNRDLATLQSRVEEHTLAVEQEIIALQEQGANINLQDPESGFTTLGLITGGFLSNSLLRYFEKGDIINTPRPVLHDAASVGNIEAIKWLLDKGEDIDILNNHGGIALHSAVDGGQYEAVNILLDSHADVSRQDRNGHTALWKLFLRTDEPITDDISIKILELLIQRGINVNTIDNYNGMPIEFLLGHNPFDEDTTKIKALLLLLSTKDIDIRLDISQMFSYFTLQDNINNLFSVEGYTKYKMAAGHNLHKAFIEYGITNQNQDASDTAAYINQIVLNNAAHLLQEAVDIAKPHVLIPNIEQSNNIYLLRNNTKKCKELKILNTKLQESGINLAGELDQRSPFYKFSAALSCVEEAEIATAKRITEIFIKNLILPELPQEQSLVEALETTTNPQEKDLVIKKLQAPGMKEVFHKGELMDLVCSFLDPQSASDFNYS